MSRIPIRITTAFLVLICTSPTFGWGGDGHKIVGRIASKHLTPEAKAGVKELLGKRTLADVSVWADYIKSDPTYKWASPLHYANVRPGAKAFNLRRDCPKQGCVVSAILRYTKVLRSKTSSIAERTEALKFLVHFVGDIHQPLHVSHRRDRGGNGIMVMFFGRKMNLHGVWDGAILRRGMKEMKWHQYADKLLKTIPLDTMEAWSKVTDPSDWATESYRLALSNAYAIPESHSFGKIYFNRNIPVVDERLQMGGVRLAVLLNSVFTVPSSQEVERFARVSFLVSMPGDTPDGAPIFIAGNHRALGGWRPAGLRLKRLDDERFQVAVSLPVGSVIEYKLTRGSWATVEKGEEGGEIANRHFRVEKDQEVNLTVARWGEAGGSSAARPSTITGDVRLHHDFPSRHLMNKRTIAVYLPPNYDEQQDRRYPVLYMHDGQNVFDAATSFLGVEWQVDEHAERLIKAGRIKPVIIVGIYNNADRANEYTPSRDAQRGVGGRAKLYALFLVKQVKPFVDRTYRTQPQREHTAVAGSSLGGLVSLYICGEYPKVFSMCGAISPSLMWNQQHWLNQARQNPAWMKHVRFWVDMGTAEGRQIEGYSRAIMQTRALVKVFDAACLVPGRDYYYQEVAGGEHNEVSWSARFDRVLLFFFGK